MNALFFGMGRWTGDLRINFPGGGDDMRLFFASLFIDAATECMPPPPPRPVQRKATHPSSAAAIIQPIKVITTDVVRPMTPLIRTEVDSKQRSRRPKRAAASAKSFSNDSGLCLKLNGLTLASLNSSKFSDSQRDIINTGYVVLDERFEFNDADSTEVADLFRIARGDIMPINNSLADIQRAQEANAPAVIGEFAPRSMIKGELTSDLGVVKKILGKLRSTESLRWITATRPDTEVSMLRSLPGTAAQFWHWDYCFRANEVTEMFWDSLPLILIVALEEDTFLDFPSGRVKIPRFKGCLFRSDQLHRGSPNKGDIATHRAFFVFGSQATKRFIVNGENQPTFEPVSEDEQELYEERFVTNMIGSPADVNTTSKKRKTSNNRKK
jgi:hypothetical protein